MASSIPGQSPAGSGTVNSWTREKPYFSYTRTSDPPSPAQQSTRIRSMPRAAASCLACSISAAPMPCPVCRRETSRRLTYSSGSPAAGTYAWRTSVITSAPSTVPS